MSSRLPTLPVLGLLQHLERRLPRGEAFCRLGITGLDVGVALLRQIAPCLLRRLEIGVGFEVEHFERAHLIDRKSTRLELQSLMRTSYAVFCLKKKNKQQHNYTKILVIRT